MVTAFWAIVVFLILIFVHEFGHFIAAKSVGITVHEFALGMGPAIFKKQYKETEYSIRILPIGGYCKMEGEDESSDDAGAFSNKSAIARLFVLVSGAFMNLLLGLIVFIVIMFMTQQVPIPVIDTIVPNSGAQIAGLQSGDRITKINNAKINSYSDLKFQLSRYNNGEILVSYIRDGANNTISLVPIKSEDGSFIIGLKPQVETLTFTTRLQNAYYQTAYWSKVVLISLGDLITGKINLNQMSGPAGIVSAIGSAAKQGVLDLLYLVAMITINLGVFNLLPIPALDGGRVFFIIIELIRRKKIPAEKEGVVHLVGFALLILLMIVATSNDIGRIFPNLFGAKL